MLLVGWFLIQSFDLFAAPEQGPGVFTAGDVKRDRTALADVKLDFLLFDIISLFFPLQGINKEHIYK